MYPSTVFARESFLDEIAHASKIDPIELRLRLLAPGDVLDLKSQKIDRARLIAVLKLVAAKSGWPLLPHEEGGRLWGRGVACNVYSEDCYIAQVAEVSLSKDLSDIKVHRIVSAVDCGLALNPLGIEGQTESAIAWGMSAALGGKINFKDGRHKNAVMQTSKCSAWTRRRSSRRTSCKAQKCRADSARPLCHQLRRRSPMPFLPQRENE